MADNSTLTTKLSSEIAVLDGSQTLTELLTLKVAAAKLGIDTAPIQTRLDAIDISSADINTILENAVANTLGVSSHKVWRPSEISGMRQVTGTSTLTLTPPSGKCVRVVYLSGGNTVGSAGLTSILRGGVNILAPGNYMLSTLNNLDPPLNAVDSQLDSNKNPFSIGQGSAYRTPDELSTPAKYLLPSSSNDLLETDVDENIQFNFASTTIVVYAYEFGNYE